MINDKAYTPCRPCCGMGHMPGELLGERCPYCDGSGFVPEEMNEDEPDDEEDDEAMI